MPGLALTELSLSHFRSHKSARIVPDHRPLAFFGANGAGKTNILEAVSLLSPGRGIRRAGADELSRQPERIGWKIAARLTSQGRQHEIETWAEPEQVRQVRIDGKAATQNGLSRIARVIWLVPSMDRLWLEGADGRRRFLDRITLSFFPDHAEVTLGYEKAMRERNRLLKDGINDPGWFRALESRMAEAGAAIIRNRKFMLIRLADAQSAAKTAFPTAALSLEDRTDEDCPQSAADLSAALEQSRSRDMAVGRTLVGPHRSDFAAVYAAKDTPARLCSTGEQKALLISLILANARALATDFGAPPIILLDEVAAHLDPDRRAALYDEICAIGAQAWLTATDRVLFEGLSYRARLFEVGEGRDGSRIQELDWP